MQSLNNTVTQLGTDLTAAGSAITNINASLSTLGGENFLYNPSFDTASPSNDSLPEGWTIAAGAGATVSSSLVASRLDPQGKAWRGDASIPTAGAVVDCGTAARSAASAGQVFTLSLHARGTVGFGLQLTTQFRNAASTLIGEANSGNIALTETWGRYSLASVAAPAGTTQVNIRFRMRQGPSSPATSGFAELDRAQLEVGPAMSGWSDSDGVIKGSIATQATATSALTGRVTQTETGLSSISGQLTTQACRDRINSDLLPVMDWHAATKTTCTFGEIGWPSGMTASDIEYRKDADTILNLLNTRGITLSYFALGDGFSSATSLQPANGVDAVGMDTLLKHRSPQ